ncbi:heme lyase CcmF/NrfE family subunit [Candidatus Entotheonella palauensis]|uniref:heme lyase CcmF/NrfE family subunit n=1 Tax=Candidatus Entotheonella palauensis TaxID=93172 RepID=UPI000B7F89C5|nr:heme lyase CcmF/NrfE family subunit [Candidatus Entotheonella palauensis]
MSDIGAIALRLALVAAAYAAVLSALGGWQQKSPWVRSAERAVYAVFGLVSIAMVVMLYALATHDFSIQYVARVSNRAMPMFYTIAALWGGQEGSLLLWLWLLVLYSALAVRQNQYRNREFIPYAIPTLMVTSILFLSLLVFAEDPFHRLPQTPIDGQGLNPLLQNPLMVIHPPNLYLGFVGYAVPFAFAIGALVSGRLDSQWIRSVRRWTIVAWLFNTVGVILGGQWAYVELGWGGYWAWDPVENASLMPWLTATAFMHSIMIQEKKGMLKVWNMSLVILTYALSIFGTFLTRSGIVSSVHAFAESDIGSYFLIYLGVIIVVSVALVIKRLPQLQSDHRLESTLSRESSFLFNNLFLVGMMFAVLWGTMFPVLSEAIRGVKISVAAPFFNQVNVPLGLALLFLAGVCPLIAWRKASVRNLTRNFSYPLIWSFVVTAVLYASGVRHVVALISLSICGFVLGTIVFEFYRGTRARQSSRGGSAWQALMSLVQRNRRRYGGYIVHLGVVLAFVGITGSSAYQIEKDIVLRPGERADVGKFTLQYDRLEPLVLPTYEGFIATVRVFLGDELLSTLKPEKRIYFAQNQPTTEVALRTSLFEDLYIILAGFEPSRIATFKVFVNPLVAWLWLGGLVMVIGTIIAIWPERRVPRPARRQTETAVSTSMQGEAG